jgi:hypothetical protein
VNRKPNRMDGWAAGEQASCSGVNLAFAGSGVRGCGFWPFPRAVKPWAFKAIEFIPEAVPAVPNMGQAEYLRVN